LSGAGFMPLAARATHKNSPDYSLSANACFA
jgi:hypothetical protein